MKRLTENIKNKNSLIKTIGMFLFAALMIYCVITLINNTADISRLNAKASSYDAQYEQQIEDNNEIKAILNSDNKDDYIEQKAREKGYVKDGETVYYDISSSK